MPIPPSLVSYPCILRNIASFLDIDPMTLSRVVARRRYIITKEVVDDVRNAICTVSVGFETVDAHPEDTHPSKVQPVTHVPNSQLHSEGYGPGHSRFSCIRVSIVPPRPLAAVPLLF